ncbi:hypothetical protein KP509_07G051400 [Ceratopteris richardii]|uniref:t-SNARE coiled-coil homology domain-containing protein n=1 Tax=Ceratopteris richardii TaxID=49495 RepID=A0A8T2UHS0_CERRI|nr:hypothetical protein KP509_07G051400 [Ceratopteris richardii]KAH7433036.1 hypothetical protein KP509_07G051400 [Ceratopteris richardii]
MASVRRRCSSIRNPFDSSDDENDNSKPAPRYINPFNDDGGANGDEVHCNSSRHQSMPRAQSQCRNPFEDEHECLGAEIASHQTQENLKSKLDRGALFDEVANSHRADGVKDSMDGPRRLNKSVAMNAFKKVQKIKAAGASQTSKMVEGGVYHAQRLKESSIIALKSIEGEKSSSSRDKIANCVENVSLDASRKALQAWRQGDPKLSGGHLRNQLFEGKARPDTLKVGGPYESGVHDDTPYVIYDDNRFQGAHLEQRSVEDLEGYSLQKTKETTQLLKKCLKITEDMKGNATHTLTSLHQQGEKLRHTHEVAHGLEQNLTVGEKLLGSLGGMFSRTWKPKRNAAMTGPINDPNDLQLQRKMHHLQQRDALGLNSRASSGQAKQSLFSISDSEAQTTEAKLKLEKTKQDDVLSDLSSVLDQLKEMSVDMGTEISRQNVSLDNFQNDVVVLDDRMKGANLRARQLLRK